MSDFKNPIDETQEIIDNARFPAIKREVDGAMRTVGYGAKEVDEFCDELTAALTSLRRAIAEQAAPSPTAQTGDPELLAKYEALDNWAQQAESDLASAATEIASLRAQVQTLTGQRDKIANDATQMINFLKGLLESHGVEIPRPTA